MPPERTIWKYQIKIEDTIVLSLPVGAEVLSIGVQHGEFCAWAAVTPGSEIEDRTIYVRGTGHPMGRAAGCRFIGTIILAGGSPGSLARESLVFHFFDGGVSLQTSNIREVCKPA